MVVAFSAEEPVHKFADFLRLLTCRHTSLDRVFLYCFVRLLLVRRMRGFTILELLIALAVLSILSAMAIPAYDRFSERARVGQAVADIGELDMEIEKFLANNFTYPGSLDDLPSGTPLDPWGQPYQYLQIRNNDEPGLRGRLRKDRNLVPINSDYDLYSMGADGATRPPLTARPSQDDVVRAGDGGFVGVAEEF